MKALPLRQGLFAGCTAGLILSLLYFVDIHPGNNLRGVAQWVALGTVDTERWIGFLLIIVLGGIFGLIFGAIQGKRETTAGGSIALGLVMGVAWWAIVRVLIGLGIHHITLSLSSLLFSFVTLLLYGVLLGTFYYQFSMRSVARL